MDKIETKKYYQIYYIKNKYIINERAKLWHRDNKDYVKERNKKYYKNNPEKRHIINLNQFKNIRIVFNMTKRQYGYALQSWSQTVRKRDNYICQVCGIRDEIKNISHHILYKAKYPELSLNLNNGITLCKKCHLETHMSEYNF